MPTLAKSTKATVIPSLRYRNAPAAIEWLCSAFGFERHAVYPNPDGTIAHAQLSFGNGMVMLGSVSGKDSEWGRLIRQPDEIDGLETQTCWTSKTKTMAAAASPVATLRATSGTSAPMIRGDARPHSAFAPVSRTTLAHFTSSLFT